VRSDGDTAGQAHYAQPIFADRLRGRIALWKKRVNVFIDGENLGTASRAIVGRPDGEENGIFLNTEIELFDPTPKLENRLNQEMFGGKNSFLLSLEYPDGRKFNGTQVWAEKLIAGKSTTLFATRGGWSP
jgi:hypothetical protein